MSNVGTTSISAASTSTRRVTSRPSVLSLGLARTGIEIRQFTRERMSMVFIFAFPIIMLVIFGSVFPDEIAPGVSFRQYFAAGMIATGIVLSSFQSLAIAIAIERDEGTLKRLRGTPMPPLAYFLGKIGLVTVTSLVQAAVLLVVGRAMYGLELPSTVGPWLRFGWVFLLGASAGTVLGIAFSVLPKSGKSAPSVVTPVVIALPFVSGVYFVYSQIPTWMQVIGAVFPLKWLTSGMRSVFLPAGFESHEVGASWQLPQTALVLAAWTVIGLVLCLRTFRWQRSDGG